MSTKENSPILIAGGGIGGLSAALGLSRKGFEVVVLERAEVFGEIGAGIQLGPNAFHCFDNLGIGDATRAVAVFIDKLRLMDAIEGGEIMHIPLDEPFRQRFRNPYAVIHRRDLHDVLLNACKKSNLIKLQTHSMVVGYDQDDKHVTALLSDKRKISGSALIGADGLWSKVRTQKIDKGAPVVSGHTTYRSVIPTEKMPEDLRWNAATLWAGPKCHLVHYPLSGWKLFNLVVTRHNDASEPVAGIPVEMEKVLSEFSHIHPTAQNIIRCGIDWKLWVLCDREPIENWTDGRVALLGDAAHPTLQYLAQGACMAVEDGVCLAEILSAHRKDLENALKNYNAQRFLRTARIQLQSRAVGQHIYHPSGVHAKLRNSIMQSKTVEQYYDSLAWLYGGMEQIMAR